MISVQQNIRKVIIEDAIPVVPPLHFSIYRHTISTCANITRSDWRLLHYLPSPYQCTVRVWQVVFQETRRYK